MQQQNSVPLVAIPQTAPSQPIRSPIRAWLLSPRGLIITGIVVIAAGLALGWNWVVALGIAPLVLSVAPCAAMCALGVCMMPKGNAGVPKPGAVDQTNPPAQE